MLVRSTTPFSTCWAANRATSSRPSAATRAHRVIPRAPRTLTTSIYHAIQYLLGGQSRDKLEAFRGYKGAQSYPSRTKDADDVDFSTGSVGLGVGADPVLPPNPGTRRAPRLGPKKQRKNRP